MSFLDHKLGLTDHESHRDLWGHKVGHGDLQGPLTILGHQLSQTNRDLWGHKVCRGDLL